MYNFLGAYLYENNEDVALHTCKAQSETLFIFPKRKHNLNFLEKGMKTIYISSVSYVLHTTLDFITPSAHLVS